MDVIMVLVEAPRADYAAAWTCTMSKTGEIISVNAAVAPLSVENKRHSSKEKQSFVNQNELKAKKIPKNEQIIP